MNHRHLPTALTTLLATFALSACAAVSDAGGADLAAAPDITTAVDGTETVPAVDAAATTSVGAHTSDDASTGATSTLDVDWSAAEEIDVSLADGASSADSTNVGVDGDVVTILASGTYRIGGDLSDGRLVVDAVDDGPVRLVLDRASINSSEPGALYIDSASAVQIWLVGDNSLSDGGSVTTGSDGDAGPNAALYSEADLTIAGAGSLTVTGNVVDGITSKDDLVIAGGTIVVDAVDDGIRGKDNLVIDAGTVVVEAGGDAMTSDNEDVSDDGSDDVGNVVVNGGVLTLSAGTDGIDGVGNVTINVGELAIAAGDDAIHADAVLSVTGGTIDIRQSYEGLEGKIVDISDGRISIVADDDGINVAGGNDGSGQMAPGGGPNRDAFVASGDQYGEISGGSIVVDADGDGIDINGSLSITGGEVVVNGPTENMNGALDVDGSFEVSGDAVLIAAGSAGMAEAPDGSSASTALSLRFQATVAAGTVLEITDDAGAVLVTFEATKPFQSFVYSSSTVAAGATYTVALDGEPVGTIDA